MRLFGREQELRTAFTFLDRAGPAALTLAGEPGIGKTAIWRELLEQARGRGWEVLCAMPSSAEVQLTFAALGDLVDGLGESALALLAAPQRRALDVALLRADGPVVDARAVGVALLAMLRARAAQRPVLIGIDDLQWVDKPSARVLGFALRRLAGAPVVVAATLRTGGDGDRPALDLSAALGPERAGRLEIGPLTLAAIHELVVARMHVEPPRRTLLALFDAAHGNPFMAVELAHELARRDVWLEPGALAPVPPSVRELVATRLAQLAPEVRELLLAASGLARPTVELLARLRPDAEATLRQAVEARVMELGFERGEVRFTHPLYARVPYEALHPHERRRLHARLAGMLDETEERARHEALAASRPSVAVASDLDRAAEAAGERGAPARAAELCTLAARLTPTEQAQERVERSLAAAQWHQRAGEIDRAAAFAGDLLGSACAGGDTRARAMSLLGSVRADTEGIRAALALYHTARHEPQTSPVTRGEVHRRIAWLRLGAGDTAAAYRHARAALALSRGRDPGGEAGAAAIAALPGVIAGGELQEGLLGLASSPTIAALAQSDQWPETAPEIVAAVTLLWAGEIEQARPPLERALARATERDEPWLVMHALAYLSSIATAAGELDLGLEHARRYVELARASEPGPQRAASLWPLTVALAWIGDESGARAAASEGLTLARESGHALYEVGCLAALGLLDLSLQRPADAAEVLTAARGLADERRIRALGRLPLLPDLIEALALSGDADGAAALAPELECHASKLGAPWALALAHRCEGLVAEARGQDERAVASFQRALDEHARQDRPPERARTELALGRTLRRQRHKRAAREVLERSLRGFEAIGAELWALACKHELARIGGRSASPDGRLTATEASIAELVAAGRTNQEVAETLHLSPRTVEWNLSKVYRKLGVRGRTELASGVAAELAAGAGEPR